MKFGFLKKAAAVITAFAMTLSMAFVLPEDTFIGTTANAATSTSYEGRLSLGLFHGAYITDDGDLYMWGGNSSGQLGDGTTTIRSTPVKVMSNVAQVSLGGEHSACVTTSGDLYTWGNNEDGQLGYGRSDEVVYYSSKPQKIMSNVAQVSLGAYYSACITANGDLYTWGSNGRGQLGDGTTTDSMSPKYIKSGVAKVSLENNHSACITTNGDLYMWGCNRYGQLGDGIEEERHSPTLIKSGVAQVSLGVDYSAYITTSGDLYMWGFNEFGQLGDGTTTSRSTPYRILSNVSQVSIGSFHSACITTSGDLYVWGENQYGQIGDGTTTKKSTPKLIKSGVAQASLGFNHSACVTTSGDVYTWGYNLCGNGSLLVPEKITVHTHTLSSKYSSDENGHWKTCSGCDKKVGYEAHTKDEGTITKEATLTEDGTVSYKCKVCGADMGEETLTLMIESIEVTEDSIIFKCSSNIDGKITSITVAFDDVTEELVDIIMKETDIYRIIDFVNSFTAADKDGILTDAQLKAIDYVLAHDLKSE